MTEAQPLSVPFNRQTLPDQKELQRIVKSAQRHGLIHIRRKQTTANPPKHKLKIFG